MQVQVQVQVHAVRGVGRRGARGAVGPGRAAPTCVEGRSGGRRWAVGVGVSSVGAAWMASRGAAAAAAAGEGDGLPGGFRENALETARAVALSVGYTGGDEKERRKREEEAGKAAKAFIAAWGGDEAVRGSPPFASVRHALEGLTRFYRANGPRAELDVDVRVAVLVDLRDVETYFGAAQGDDSILSLLSRDGEEEQGKKKA